MKKIIVAICLLINCVGTFAQYTGGSGDGYASTAILNIPKLIANAGPDQTIDCGDPVLIGSAGNVGNTYSWRIANTTTVIGTLPQITVNPEITTTYILTVDSLGCVDRDTILVTVIPALSVPPISGPSSLCAGSTINLYNTLTGGTWSSSNSGIATISSTGLVTGITSGTVTITYSITTNCGTNTVTKQITVYTLPNLTTITGLNPVCVGTTTIYSVANVSGDTYNWLINSNGVIVSGQGTSSISVIWNFAGVGQLNVTETSPAGCSSSATQLSVQINPLPNITTISGSTIVCLGDTINYSVANVAGHSYNWTLNSNGAILSGQGTNSINVIWGSAGTGIINVTETIIATGCLKAATPLSVTISPQPTLTNINGPISVCANSITTYTVPYVMGHSYIWSVSGNGSISSGQGLNSINVIWGVSGTAIINVTETIVSSGCSKAATPLNITVNPQPTIVISTQPDCAENLLTYFLSVTVNSGVVTSTYGTVTNSSGNIWSIQSIPSGNNITLTVTDVNGCTNTLAITAPICNCPSIAPPISGGNVEYCFGEPIPTITATAGSGFVVQWFNTPVAGSILATGNSYIPTAPGTYYAQTFDPLTNCISNTRTPISVTLYPVPNPLIIGIDEVCSGDTVTYSVSQVIGDTYSWIVNGNGSMIAGQGTNAITVVWGNSGTGTINVTETISSTGCSKAAAPLNVTINSLSLIGGITGSLTVCVGSVSVYSVQNSPGNTYNWELITNGQILAGQGTSSIAVLWNTPGVVTLGVTETSSSAGCSQTALQLSITINPQPTIVISSTPVCAANLLTYSLSVTVSSGTVVCSAGNSTNTSGNIWLISAVPTGTNVTVTVNNSNGCSNSILVPSPACACPPVGVPISGGNVSYCFGTPIPTISASAGLGQIVAWYSAATGGVLLATGNTYAPYAPGTYYAQSIDTVTNCVSDSRVPVIVTVNPLPNPVISGDNYVCSGEILNYNVTNIPGSTYTWSINGNGIIVAGQGTNSISIAWGEPGLAYINLTQTTAAGCVNSAASFLVYINPLPLLESINGPLVVCQSNISTYSLPNVMGHSYTWVLNSLGQIVSGQGTNSINVRWNTPGEGWVDVTEYIVSTGCPRPAVQLHVLINPIPNLSTISGPNIVCIGDTVTYNVSFVNGDTYNWAVNSNGTILSGQGTNSINVVWRNNGAATVDLIETISATGCAKAATQLLVTVSPLPTLTTINGPIITCANGNSTFSVPNVTGHTYNWTINGNGTISSSQGSNTITVHWGASGTVTINVTETITSSGCSKAANQLIVTINPLPTINISNPPDCAENLLTYFLSVTVSSGTVTSSAGSVTNTNGNVWTISSVPTGTNITVTVTDAFGCINSIPVSAPNCDCPPIAQPISAGNVAYCQGDAIPAITASAASGMLINWYSSAGGTTVLATGNSFTPTAPGTYYAESQEPVSDCKSNTRTPITLTVNPLPNPIIIGNGIACENDIVTYSVNNVNGNTYNWSVNNNGVINSGQGTNSITVTWGTAGICHVNVTEIITATGCYDEAAQLNVTVNPLPTLNVISGPSSACSGDTVTYLIPLTSGHDYQWIISANGEILTGDGTNSINVVWNTAGAGTVDISETIENTGCTRVLNQLNVNVLAAPTINFAVQPTCSPDLLTYYMEVTISTDTVISSRGTVNRKVGNIWLVKNVPSGINIILTVTSANLCTESIEVTAPDCSCPNINAPISNGNKEYCEGEQVPPISATVNSDQVVDWYSTLTGGVLLSTGNSYIPTASGIYYAQARDTITNCVSNDRTAISITLIQLATPKIMGDSVVCNSETVIYNVISLIGHSYNWTVTGNGTILSGQGTNSITVTWWNQGVGTVDVHETIISNGCSKSADQVKVVINPLPDIEVTGLPTCTNDLKSYYMEVDISSGILISSSGIATNTSANIWSITDVPAGTDIVLSVTDTNTCENSLSVTAPDCNCPPLTAPISGGNKEYCSGDPIPPITASVGSGLVVDWFATANSMTLLSTGISFTPTTPGTYFAQARDPLSNCKSSTRTAVTITVNPLPTPNIIGDNIVCIGETLTYQTSFVTGNSYNWLVTDNGTIVSGQGTNSIKVIWNNSSSANVNVTETINATGCNKTTEQFVVTVNPLPTISTINGSENVCANETLVYSVFNTIGSSYYWEINGNAQIISGQGTNSISVAFNSISSISTVTVDVTETIAISGCSKSAEQLTITVNPLPALTIIYGQASVCKGDTVNYYVAEENAINYNWQIDNSGTIYSGQGTNSIYVIWNIAGIATVDLTETIISTACSKSSEQLSVVVNELPEISPISGLDKVKVGSTIQLTNISTGGVWSSSDELIAEINQNGLLSGNKVGTVIITYKITNSNQCTDSVSYLVKVLSAEILIAKSTVSIPEYRKNTSEHFYISLLLKDSENLISDGTKKNFTAKISFNSTLLVPDFELLDDIIDDNRRTITFSSGIDSAYGIMKDMPFIATLGNDTCTVIDIDTVIWEGDQEVVLIKENGSLCLNDVCSEGGNRLLNSTGIALFKSIIPNPANDNVTINFSIIEKGETKIQLVNTLGELIKSIELGSNNEPGTKSITISVQDLSSGQYMLIMRTPSITDTKVFMILK